MGSTKIILSEQKKEVYIKTLKKAQGQRSLNEFARNAGLSPGNLSRIMKGQVGTPETLSRIAKVSPKTSYQELMTAAGYIEEKGKRLGSSAEETENNQIVSIPLMRNKHSHNAIVKKNGGEMLFYSSSVFGEGDFIFFEVGDDAMAPLLKTGDHVLIDKEGVPQDHELALIRINRKDILVRRISRVGTKYQVYGDNHQFPPMLVTKANLHIYGTVVRAITKPV